MTQMSAICDLDIRALPEIGYTRWIWTGVYVNCDKGCPLKGELTNALPIVVLYAVGHMFCEGFCINLQAYASAGHGQQIIVFIVVPGVELDLMLEFRIIQSHVGDGYKYG